MEEFKFNTIPEAIQAIRNGEMVVVVDDPDRENEGDLIMAAEKVTTESVNFMISKAKGLLCVPMEQNRLEYLQINMMCAQNTDRKCTAFTESVDAFDCTTGISAAERAHTIRTLVDDSSTPSSFTHPGHIFPLMAKPYGVLERAGHTETAVDLAKLAGLKPAGAICEIIKEDGTMARTPDLMDFAAEHNLKIITVADLITYRRHTEKLVERVTVAEMPTQYGTFRAYGYVNKINGEHHVAIVKGDVTDGTPTLVRVHSECLTGDTFGSLRCDCGDQLHEALRRIEKAGKGVVLYLRQEGRGIGLINKLKAYVLQEQGMDTVEANVALGFAPDLRDYGIGAEILADLGIRKMILMTNNPLKITGLDGYGLEVVSRDPIEMTCNEKNEFYLYTKYKKMGHILHVRKEWNDRTVETESSREEIQKQSSDKQ